MNRVSAIFAVFFLALWVHHASATPIVIMKTQTGFIVATNGSREGGQRVCKLQYNNSEVTLHASATSLSKALSGETIFDMNEVLWSAYKQADGYIGIGSLAQALDDAVARRSTDFVAVSSFQFHLVNVSAAGVFPEVVGIADINTPRAWTFALDEPLHKLFALKEGEALVWGYTPTPEKQNEEPTLAGVERLLDKLIPPGDKGDFGPPYLIGRLDEKGFRFVISDEGICTAQHPAPLVNEKVIPKSRATIRKRR